MIGSFELYLWFLSICFVYEINEWELIDEQPKKTQRKRKKKDKIENKNTQIQILEIKSCEIRKKKQQNDEQN